MSAPTEKAESPTTTLARIIEPLDSRRAATLRESFGAMFDKVVEWQSEAAGLRVTAEDQTGKMDRARSLRLEIKRVRVALEKKRKDLKSAVLVEGRAIDGAYSVFEGLALPVETFLEEQETFAARTAKAREDALRAKRALELLDLGVLREAIPPTLGEMSETLWGIMLADAQAAKMARDQRAKVDAEARAAAEKKAAEEAATRRQQESATRAENERLRKEAAERDAAAKVEREKVAKAQAQADAKLREEQAARAKAEAEATALRRQVEDKAKAPLIIEGKMVPATRAKHALAVMALKEIAARATEPVSAARATEVLIAIGEMEPPADVDAGDDDFLGRD